MPFLRSNHAKHTNPAIPLCHCRAKTCAGVEEGQDQGGGVGPAAGGGEDVRAAEGREEGEVLRKYGWDGEEAFRTRRADDWWFYAEREEGAREEEER